MAMVLLDISNYLVFAYGGPHGNANARAAISLGISGAMGYLSFYPDSTPVPANTVGTHASGVPMYYVNYPYAQYTAIIDLLRNEKPVRLFFRDDTMAAHITTSNEPVGENE
jgi:hypothetical protein